MPHTNHGRRTATFAYPVCVTRIPPDASVIRMSGQIPMDPLDHDAVVTLGQATMGTSSSGDNPTSETFASGELISSVEVLARIRTVLEERRVGGSELPLPQTLLPLDADEVEALEFYPWRRTIGARVPVQVDDLLVSAPETFVARCYRLLLRRSPEGKEARWRANFRPETWARLVLIARLHWSAEGRQAAVPLSGIGLRLVPGWMPIARRLQSAFRRAP